MKLQEIIEKTLTGLGFELVEVELSPAKLIRVYIDKPEGVNVEDCAYVSNHLNRVLSVENYDYNRLEISSPGLERALKKLEDYKRFIGHTIKIKTHELIDNNKIFQGKLLKVIDEIINVELHNRVIVQIKLSQINRCRLVYEPKTSPTI